MAQPLPLLWPHTFLLLFQETGYDVQPTCDFYGILLVCPKTVITEFLGIQTGFFL